MHCKNGVPFNPHSVHLFSPLSFVAYQFCPFFKIATGSNKITRSPIDCHSIHLAIWQTIRTPSIHVFLVHVFSPHLFIGCLTSFPIYTRTKVIYTYAPRSQPRELIGGPNVRWAWLNREQYIEVEDNKYNFLLFVGPFSQVVQECNSFCPRVSHSNIFALLLHLLFNCRTHLHMSWDQLHIQKLLNIHHKNQ